MCAMSGSGCHYIGSDGQAWPCSRRSAGCADTDCELPYIATKVYSAIDEQHMSCGSRESRTNFGPTCLRRTLRLLSGFGLDSGATQSAVAASFEPPSLGFHQYYWPLISSCGNPFPSTNRLADPLGLWHVLQPVFGWPAIGQP